MEKILFAALLAVSGLALTESTNAPIHLLEATCTTSADCGANECCYIKPEFMVVSKRQLLLPPQHATLHKTGVCESYKPEGAHCDSFETMNGHCGCESGLHCLWVPDQKPAGRRSMVYHPEPGSYQCSMKH